MPREKQKVARFEPIVVWATWRGPGFVPCLWSSRLLDVERDPDETVFRVRVTRAVQPCAPKHSSSSSALPARQLVDQWRAKARGWMQAKQTGVSLIASAYRECADELAALKLDQWQPIETAPKDGTWILVTGCNTSPMVLVAGYREEKQLWQSPGRWVSYGFVTVERPTYWMPLPAPPARAALLDPAPLNQQESVMDDLAFLDAINNPPVGARFHWRDDWYFQRTKLGAVLLTLPDKSQKVIPPNEWASIVASVSARGETGNTFREAEIFHGGGSVE